MPNTIQILDIETLEKALQKAGFQILEGGYFPIEGEGEWEKDEYVYTVARK